MKAAIAANAIKRRTAAAQLRAMAVHLNRVLDAAQARSDGFLAVMFSRDGWKAVVPCPRLAWLLVAGILSNRCAEIDRQDACRPHRLEAYATKKRGALRKRPSLD